MMSQYLNQMMTLTPLSIDLLTLFITYFKNIKTGF